MILHLLLKFHPNGTTPKILKVGHSRPVNRGHWWHHIWTSQPRFAYSLHNFHGAMIKGSLLQHSHYHGLLMQNFLNVVSKIGPKFLLLLGEKTRSTAKILFLGPQKAHPCAKRHHLVYWSWKLVPSAWRWQNPKKLASHFVCTYACGGGRRWEAKSLYRIEMKFCTVVGVLTS